MASPREILAERLARGEIDEAEFERLSAKLGQPAASADRPAPASGGVAKRHWYTTWRGYVAAGVIVALGVSYFTRAPAYDVVIGDLKYDGISVSFKLANDSKTSGDVVFWFVQDGVDRCPKVMSVKAKSAYEVKVRCDLSKGKYVVRHNWASNEREQYLVAERI